MWCCVRLSILNYIRTHVLSECYVIKTSQNTEHGVSCTDVKSSVINQGYVLYTLSPFVTCTTFAFILCIWHYKHISTSELW